MRSALRSMLGGLITVGLTASAGFGAGFQVPEQGAASMALGMGFIGRANDLSAMYHNPAGLTQLEGRNLYLGVAGISPTAEYSRKPGKTTPVGGLYGVDTASTVQFPVAKTKDDLVPVPAVGYGQRLGGDEGKLALGVGITAPYGLRSDYASTGPQRYMTTSISLTTIYAGPYLAYQATKAISVGAGVQYVYGKAKLGQHINYGGSLLQTAAAQQRAGNATLMTLLSTRLVGSATSPGNPVSMNENPAFDGVMEVADATDQGLSFNIGVLGKVNDQLHVGATFRKGVALKVEGDVSVDIPDTLTRFTTAVNTLNPAFPKWQDVSTTGSTTVNLPDVYGLGFCYQPIAKMQLTGDFNWNRWNTYKNLDFAFGDSAAYFPGHSSNPRDWENAIAIRVGGEYAVAGGQALRLGYLYDQEPIPDESVGPELPTNDRNGITLGYGLTMGKATIDLAYCHLFIKDRTVTSSWRGPSAIPVGDYTAAANIAGLTLSYRM